ncbi:hypothetical protein [Natrinema halophilum]|uniref:hypothetical protein n=1 Tax=Natrinema halophilum TaxID=1699371 RepID=UPI001F3179AF|nr:hypothetical protein [Natrinema halophilum]UHQ96468.1 hypothetical protein HYG82_23385 [Natrinema halophilum]
MEYCTFLFVLSATFAFAAFVALLTSREREVKARVAETYDEDPRGETPDLGEYDAHESWRV